MTGRESLGEFAGAPFRAQVCTCAGPMVNAHDGTNRGHSYGCSANPHTAHEMPVMGAWDDGGIAWLPRSKYTRAQARTMYADHTGADWIDVSVLARWARWDPENPSATEYDGEYWVECQKAEPGAFQVWRCE